MVRVGSVRIRKRNRPNVGLASRVPLSRAKLHVRLHVLWSAGTTVVGWTVGFVAGPSLKKTHNDVHVL